MNESSDQEPRPMFSFGFEETMEHIFIKQQGTIPKLLPYRTNKFKKIKEDYQALDPELQQIWHRLFIRVRDQRSPQEELDLEKILAFPIRKSDQMPACGRILKEGQIIYRCFDCGLHVTSVMCRECFEEADHRGHRYETMVSLGGTCDCGNLGSLKPQGFCKKHCGIVKIPHIDSKERERFLKINKKLYQWFLVLHIRDGYQALSLLVNQILYLDRLNTDSLYYNRLTYEWLNSYVINKKTNKEEMIAESILVMGPKHFDTNLDKWATELFLKMFALDEVKQLLAELYLKTYNTTMRFETSQFKDLFIQMFSTLKIIKKTMQKTGVSLDPKKRQDDYNISEYYNQLLYIDCLDSESAREFYRPLIKNKGVDYANMRYIYKSVDNGHYKIEDFYREKWHHQNGYYQIIKALAKHFQGFQQDIAQQIINECNMCIKYQYRKNQAMIPHHRGAALFIFVYFQCDLTNIDPDALMKILKIDREYFLDVAKQMLKRYLSCIREFARSLGHREYDTYQFDSYLPLYIAKPDGQKVFILDCLGLKVFGTIFHKMKEHQQLHQVLFEVYREEEQKVAKDVYWLNNDLNSARNRMSGQREMMRRHLKDRRRNHPDSMQDEEDEMNDCFEREFMYRRHMEMGCRQGQPQNSKDFINQTQQKLARINVTYFAQLIHFIFFLFESVYIERPEVMIANDCKIRNSVTQKQNQNQLIQILSNVQEISAEDMETVITFFFGDIDRDEILEVANFDRVRKVYSLKPETKGTPICKDLLHSFIDNDTYLKYSTRGIVPNQNNKILRNIYLPQQILQLFLSKLIQIFKSSITEKRVTLLKYLAGLLRLVGFAYGHNSNIFIKFKKEILQIAQKENVLDQIQLVFQQSGSSNHQETNQAEQKRVQELRKKQKEKLKEKTTTQTQNIKKILQANPAEKVQAFQERQQCILCRGTQGLFYMGLYGESSLIFNTFREKGTYPYFQCCFHLMHLDCFGKVSGGKQQTSCPFCRSVCNILLPTEPVFNDPKLLKSFNERLQVISALRKESKNSNNLTAYLTKTFIPVFFVSLLQNKEVSSKKIDLYRIILKVIRSKYDEATVQEKRQIEQMLINTSKEYQGMHSPFPLSNFIALVNGFVSIAIKRQELDEKGLLINLISTSKLDQSDIQKCINLAVRLFGISQSNQKIIKSPVTHSSKPLSEVIKLYNPPQNIKELLHLRINEEKQCKSGHNICLCIICQWKGCADCSLAVVHAAEDHCNHSIFFSFVSGGLIYISNGSKFALPCLYLNQKTSEPWRAEKRDEDFLFNQKSYDEMLGLLLEENLTEYVSKMVKQSDIHLLI